MLVQTDGVNLLTDPLWSDRASPLRFVGPKRVHAPGVALDDLPPIDIVLEDTPQGVRWVRKRA